MGLFKKKKDVDNSQDNKIDKDYLEIKNHLDVNEEKEEAEHRKKVRGKLCNHCNKLIGSHTKWVLVGTYNADNKVEEQFFHFDCWKNFFSNCVLRKVELMNNEVMSAVAGVVDNMMKENLNEDYNN